MIHESERVTAVFYSAVLKAIREMGIDEFQKTSFFGSNLSASEQSTGFKETIKQAEDFRSAA